MPHQEMHFLTADQVATLADGMPEPYDLMVRFVAYTGLRAGEIARLRPRHLRLDDAKVVVLTAVSEVRGDLVEHDHKSYSSRRAVKLPAFLVE
jgi:integrase